MAQRNVPGSRHRGRPAGIRRCSCERGWPGSGGGEAANTSEDLLRERAWADAPLGGPPPYPAFADPDVRRNWIPRCPPLGRVREPSRDAPSGCASGPCRVRGPCFLGCPCGVLYATACDIREQALRVQDGLLGQAPGRRTTAGVVGVLVRRRALGVHAPIGGHGSQLVERCACAGRGASGGVPGPTFGGVVFPLPPPPAPLKDVSRKHDMRVHNVEAAVPSGSGHSHHVDGPAPPPPPPHRPK